MYIVRVMISSRDFAGEQGITLQHRTLRAHGPVCSGRNTRTVRPSATPATLPAIVMSLLTTGLAQGAVAGHVPSAVSKVWSPDLGDGRYRNPILYADYPDPDVIRIGNDFYLTASSFNAVPGLPILHSTELVNWSIIGHALPRQPLFDVFAHPQHGKGVWAPAIRHHNGQFVIYYADPDFGIYVVKATHPAGPGRRLCS